MFERKNAPPQEKLVLEMVDLPSEETAVFETTVRYVGGNGEVPAILSELRDAVISGEGFLELAQKYPQFHGVICKVKEEAGRGRVSEVDVVLMNYTSKDWLFRFHLILSHLYFKP